MIEIGATVNAIVVRVEPYGIYLRYHDDDIFVDLVQISWTAYNIEGEQFLPGNEFKVVIYARRNDNFYWYGSIKEAYPDRNPYLAYAESGPGVVIFCVIWSKLGDEILFVRLDNGAFGVVNSPVAAASCELGDRIKTKILKIDTREGRLDLEFISK